MNPPFDIKKELENTPQAIHVDVNQLPRYKCPYCKGEVFSQQGVGLKIVPATISRTGKPDPLVAKVFYCIKCRKEVKELTQLYVTLVEQVQKMLIAEMQHPSRIIQ